MGDFGTVFVKSRTGRPPAARRHPPDARGEPQALRRNTVDLCEEGRAHHAHVFRLKPLFWPVLAICRQRDARAVQLAVGVFLNSIIDLYQKVVPRPIEV